MPAYRGYMDGAVMLNGKMYVIGGITTVAGTTNTVYEWDIANNAPSWVTKPPMPYATMSHFVKVVGDKNHVMGGDANAGVSYNTHWIYTPGADW